MLTEGIDFIPIGIIHSELDRKDASPIQSARSDIEATVEVFPQYQEGLSGVEGFSHIFLFYVFNQTDQKVKLRVKPFLDDQLHGLFATRFPVRPNPLGFSIVRLIGIKENRLYVRGADILDGTSLLDIKPYIPDFDVFKADKLGWYQNRKYK